MVERNRSKAYDISSSVDKSVHIVGDETVDRSFSIL